MSNVVYLPLVARDVLDPCIGAQIEGAVASVQQWVVPGRGYQLSISWKDFPARSDVYDDNARRLQGCPLMLTVKCVPPACRLWPEWVSSPPAISAYPALVDFCKLLIDRYHPARLELFNEPNVYSREAEDYQELFGAWIGPGEAPHIAGARYGAMLQTVYWPVKAYDPTVMIVAGALMRNEHALSFLDGMRGAPADCVSCHFYMRLESADFRKLGDYLAELRVHTSLPLAISETSILDEEDTPALEQRQYDWLLYLSEVRAQLGLRFVNWYTLAGNDWLCSDLAPGKAWDLFAGK
jgi:hypothetical protein